jgi:site-specific DNA recombinase
MPYCLYLRKSRADAEAEARGEGETLARHEKILLDLAKRMKLNITQIYKELVSGDSIAARPMMQQVLMEVEKGLWDGVLVVEVERLARGDTIDQGIVAQTFKYSDTHIITPTKVYNPNNEFDEEYFEFGLFMSRREYKTIKRRLQQGRMMSVKEGKYVGNIPPFGYLRQKLIGEKGFTLVPDQQKADTVKLIFEMYTNGIGVSRIVRRLNDMKASTAKGGDWVNATVQDILRNPVYIGKVRWNSRAMKKKMENGKIVTERPRAQEDEWILADGLHEAIIDEDTFQFAQELLSKNRKPSITTNRTIKNPLAGLIICGKCGRRMSRRPYKSGQQDTLMCPVTSCDNVSSYLSLVEDKLLQALEKWFLDYKVKLDENSHQTDTIEPEMLERSIVKLQKDIGVYEKQMDNLHNLLEQGVYDIDKFLERSKVLGDNIRAANDDIAILEEEIKQLNAREESKRVIIPKVQTVLEVYRSVEDPAKKNKLLKEVLDKVIYLKENTNGRWSDAAMDDFVLVLSPNVRM